VYDKFLYCVRTILYYNFFDDCLKGVKYYGCTLDVFVLTPVN